MKNLCLSITLLVSVNIGFGQADFMAKSDSLTKLLAGSNQDLERARLLSQLHEMWGFKNLTKSIAYGKEALVAAKKSGDINEILGCMYRLAFAYMVIGDAPKSIDLLQQVLPLTEHTEPDGYATALGFISMNYKNQGDYENALKYARQGYAIENKLFKEKKRIDKRAYLGSPMNLADIYEKSNQLDSALHYGQLSYDRLWQEPLPASEAFFEWNIRWIFGDVQRKLHHSASAMTLLKEALKHAVTQKYDTAIQGIELSMAHLFRQTNQPDSAITYATRAFEHGQVSTNYQIVSEAGFLLKELYQQRNNPARALHYSDQATIAKDSLLSVEKTRQVQNLTLKEERRQQELEASGIAYQNQIRQYALLASLAVFLLIALFLYRNNAQKQRLNERLNRQKEEIEILNKGLENKVVQRTTELQVALQEAQEALLKGQTTERRRVASELHDNLGGLLAALKMTTNTLDIHDLHSQEQEIYAQIVGMINDANHQVRSLSHNLLPEELEKAGLVFSLEKLISKLNISHQTKFDLRTEGLTERLDKQTEFNLYAIVLELCNNILKHANATEASVELIQKNGAWQLLVSDDGAGFEATKTPKDGVGLKNLYERAEAIGAVVRVHSEKGEGTVISLKINHPSHSAAQT